MAQVRFNHGSFWVVASVLYRCRSWRHLLYKLFFFNFLIYINTANQEYVLPLKTGTNPYS